MYKRELILIVIIFLLSLALVLAQTEAPGDGDTGANGGSGGSEQPSAPPQPGDGDSGSDGGSESDEGSNGDGDGDGDAQEPGQEASSGKNAQPGWISILLGTSMATGTSMFDLLYDKDELYEKRAEARRKMRDMFGGPLPGSTEFWVDTVCASKIPKVGGGFAFVDVQDQIRVVAHVEGEKQKLVTHEENTTTGEVFTQNSNLYKLSFQITNRDESNRTLKFNVFVDAMPLFNNSVKLENGRSFSRTGRSTIVQVSDNDYSRICIKFTNRDIEVRNGEDWEKISEVCNEIKDNGFGTSTTYTPPRYSVGSGSSGGGVEGGTMMNQI